MPKLWQPQSSIVVSRPDMTVEEAQRAHQALSERYPDTDVSIQPSRGGLERTSVSSTGGHGPAGTSAVNTIVDHVQHKWPWGHR